MQGAEDEVFDYEEFRLTGQNLFPIMGPMCDGSSIATSTATRPSFVRPSWLWWADSSAR